MSDAGRRSEPGAQAIVVAGMHRSGTSAFTRVLSLLGLELPRTLYPPRTGNPLGFWESEPVVAAQDAFLGRLGSTFRDTSAWPESVLESPAARAFQNRLAELLRAEYGDAPQFVVKDPRICRLMPLWLGALDEIGATPHIVLPVRNPLEVAASLRGRDEKIDLTARSLLMWLRYVLDAERYSRGYARSVVSYDDLLTDWRGVADKLAADLSLTWPRATHVAKVEIESFLSNAARHHTVDTETVMSREDVPAWVKRTYAVLLAAAAGGPVDEPALDEVRADLDRADAAYGPLLAHAELQLAEEQERVASESTRVEELATQLEGARDEAERLVTDLAGAKKGGVPKQSGLTSPTPHERRKGGWSQIRLRPLFLLLRVSRSPGLAVRRTRTYATVVRSGIFDADYYTQRYTDVAQSGIDPIVHYVLHGAAEGRQPSAGGGWGGGGFVEVVGGTAPERGGQAPRTRERAPRNLATPTIAPTDQSDFTVLLARQRSGTNAVRSVLMTHPDVHCFGEIFWLAGMEAASGDPLRELNFFTFLERSASGDFAGLLPNRTEAIFLDYLDYLRANDRRKHIVVDVKVNTMHFLTPTWQSEVGVPALFELMRKHNVNVLHLTRKNLLRYHLSEVKAAETERFISFHGDAESQDVRVRLDPRETLRQIRRCAREDALIARELASFPSVLHAEYADLFPGDVVIAPEFLSRFAAWRGIKNEFELRSSVRKQSALPFEETIENWDEIRTILGETEFAAHLVDEPAYHSKAAPPPALASAPAPPSDPEADAVYEQAKAEILTLRGTQEVLEPLKRTRPPWVEGSLSQADTTFLFQAALEHGSPHTIEIGAASGYSTTVLAVALEVKAASGGLDPGWKISSYDRIPCVYYDESRRIGDVARDVLPPDLLRRIDFRAPALALDAAAEHEPDDVSLAFIDAHHSHPWPTLDLLALVDVLRPGAVVVLHDINLPVIYAESDAVGAQLLFDLLDVEKEASTIDHEGNIGSVVIPVDKEGLRRQLIAILDAHPWQVSIPDRLLDDLQVTRHAEPA